MAPVDAAGAPNRLGVEAAEAEHSHCRLRDLLIDMSCSDLKAQGVSDASICQRRSAPAVLAPKAGVEVAPKPPNAGVLLAPKSGVLAAPKAGELPNREGLLCWAKAEALLAPNSDVVAPKAGVLETENGLLNAIDRGWRQFLGLRTSMRGSDRQPTLTQADEGDSFARLTSKGGTG